LGDQGGGCVSDLEYPKKLLPAERAEAETMIGVLNTPLAQQVLDEGTGIIQAGAIRASPLGCLRALSVFCKTRRSTLGVSAGLSAKVAKQVRNTESIADTPYERPELPTQITLPAMPRGQLCHPSQTGAHVDPDRQPAPCTGLPRHGGKVIETKACGGPCSKALTPEQRKADREVRLTISRELGHGRESVTNTYLGR
jgi:hypothetical protein